MKSDRKKTNKAVDTKETKKKHTVKRDSKPIAAPANSGKWLTLHTDITLLTLGIARDFPGDYLIKVGTFESNLSEALNKTFNNKADDVAPQIQKVMQLDELSENIKKSLAQTQDRITAVISFNNLKSRINELQLRSNLKIIAVHEKKALELKNEIAALSEADHRDKYETLIASNLGFIADFKEKSNTIISWLTVLTNINTCLAKPTMQPYAGTSPTQFPAPAVQQPAQPAQKSDQKKSMTAKA